MAAPTGPSTPRPRLACITLIALMLLSLAASGDGLHPAAHAQAQEQWQSRVDPWVLEQAANGPAEFILYLQAQADLQPAQALKAKNEKGLFVYQALTQAAAQTQAPLVRLLDQRGLAYRQFWIANMIWVRAEAADLEMLARQPSIAHIYANPSVQAPAPEKAPPVRSTSQADPAAPESVEWNLLKVNAHRVWSTGKRGQGVVIGGQDTGYEWDHPALRLQYRGWDGASSNHNYHWHDAIHENNPNTFPGNPCGFDSPLPCDDHGHGTHTMGIMVGDDGSANADRHGAGSAVDRLPQHGTRDGAHPPLMPSATSGSWRRRPGRKPSRSQPSAAHHQ
jgi:serine protease AprX